MPCSITALWKLSTFVQKFMGSPPRERKFITIKLIHTKRTTCTSSDIEIQDLRWFLYIYRFMRRAFFSIFTSFSSRFFFIFFMYCVGCVGEAWYECRKKSECALTNLYMGSPKLECVLVEFESTDVKIAYIQRFSEICTGQMLLLYVHQ